MAAGNTAVPDCPAPLLQKPAQCPCRATSCDELVLPAWAKPPPPVDGIIVSSAESTTGVYALSSFRDVSGTRETFHNRLA